MEKTRGMELAETEEYSHDHNSQWSLEHLQMCLNYIRLTFMTFEYFRLSWIKFSSKTNLFELEYDCNG